MLIEKEISFIATSDPAQGAINRSPDGSSFEVQLEEPLSIPRNALNVSLQVEEATVIWSVPNIITGTNDKIYVFGDDNQAIPVPQLFTVTIPKGLYDVNQLNASILSQLEALGARTLDGSGDPLPLINLLADTATQKVIIRLNYTNVTVDFTQPDTFREILGFNSQVIGPLAGAPINVLADNVAAFNTINYFLISSDIVNKGIRFNNRYNQIIGQVLIDVSPGSQIVSTPFNPPKIDMSELIGTNRTNIRFNLYDDSFRSVDTNGENWTCRLAIRYLMPVGNE